MYNPTPLQTGRAPNLPGILVPLNCECFPDSGVLNMGSKKPLCTLLFVFVNLVYVFHTRTYRTAKRLSVESLARRKEYRVDTPHGSETTLLINSFLIKQCMRFCYISFHKTNELNEKPFSLLLACNAQIIFLPYRPPLRRQHCNVDLRQKYCRDRCLYLSTGY